MLMEISATKSPAAHFPKTMAYRRTLDELLATSQQAITVSSHVRNELKTDI
jgi:hypothetical protein